MRQRDTSVGGVDRTEHGLDLSGQWLWHWRSSQIWLRIHGHMQRNLHPPPHPTLSPSGGEGCCCSLSLFEGEGLG